MPTYTLAELSEKLGETYEGDGSTILTGVAEIASAKKGNLSFVANPKYVTKIESSLASALIVPTDLETDFRPILRTSNPYLTFTKALYLFHQDNRRTAGGVHPEAKVASDVTLGKDITIMAHAIIESGAKIGDRVVIYPGVFIGANSEIGNEVTLYPNVSISENCSIQHDTIVHSGCRIGTSIASASLEDPHPVILESNVELGANVVISGTPHAPTVVGEGTKIDNLVQVGEGTKIGEHCIIVAQITIGDHVIIHERVTIAGQVVVSPNIEIGARSRIGAKSVVTKDVPSDADFWGMPAQPHSQEKRLKANLFRLPKLFDKIKTMEDRLKDGK